VFSVTAILAFAGLAAALVAAVLAALPVGRRHGRFTVAAGASFVGFTGWNLTLDATHATGFNTDAPVVGLSWADTGSGVMAFVVTVLIFGLVTETTAPGRQIVGLAALSGALAALVDLFVL
jgi:hypothetical protein